MFPPTKAENTRRDNSERKCGLSRKRRGIDHAQRLKRAAGGFKKEGRRERATSKNLDPVANASPEIRTIFGKQHPATVISALGGVSTNSASISCCWNTAFGESLIGKASPPVGMGHGYKQISLWPSDLRASPSLVAHRQISYGPVDSGCQQRLEENFKRSQRKGNQRSDSSPSVRDQFSGIIKESGPTTDRGDYGGLYGSDDDIDTSAWDLDSVCSSISDVEKEKTTASLGDSGDASSFEFVLSAIENEIDLAGNGLGVDISSDEECLKGGSTDGSDASPDPGTLERQCERNTRLAGLLGILSQELASTEPSQALTRKGDIRGDDSGHLRGEGVINGPASDPEKIVESVGRCITSAKLLARTLGVLFRVTDRPRGVIDASPPSIAELPGLLAALLVVRLAFPSLLANRCGIEIFSQNDEPGDEEHGGGEHLMKACRHLFEVSKRARADVAFFSSGTVTGLLVFIDLAASGFDSISTVNTKVVGNRNHGEECNKNFFNEGNRNSNIDDIRRTNSSTSNSDNSDSSVSDQCIGIGGGCVGSICDALAFAVGCLKNVSTSEVLQNRLVQAGAISTLCRLVGSTRDICRRCDVLHKKSLRPASSNSSDEGKKYKNQDKTHISDALSDSNGKISFKKGYERSNSITLLQRRVSPPLAQAINLLRDVAMGKDKHDKFRAAGVVGILCSILRPFQNQQDVVLNASRALAKLTLQREMREDTNSDPTHVRDILAALVQQGQEIEGVFSDMEENGDDLGTARVNTAKRRRDWKKEEKRIAVCVRLAFALGNLTSVNDANRGLIGLRLGGAESLSVFFQTAARAHLIAYERLNAFENTPTNDDNFKGYPSSVVWDSDTVHENSWRRETLRSACDGLEEMLVKIVRLLANISINEDVGQQVCRHPGLVILEPLLGKCLEVFGLFEDGTLPYAPQLPRGRCQTGEMNNAVLSERLIPGEELLLNVVSLVTNLSFYGPRAGNPKPGGYARGCSKGKFLDVHVGKSGAMKSAPAAESPYLNNLFALASKARRCKDEYTPRTYSTTLPFTTQSHSEDEFTSGGDNFESLETAPCCRLGNESSIRGFRREVLCGHLVKVLLHPNVEAVTEAARAFGNFSRDPFCREAMARRRADEVLVALLGHACREVSFAAVGALVNIAADPARKALLYRENVGAGERLARLVRRAGLADYHLAEFACQALHNLLIEPLPTGGVEQVLGGAGVRRQLRWTLQELIKACSCEEFVDNICGADGGARLLDSVEDGKIGRGGEGSSGFGGLPAALAAVWKTVGEKGTNPLHTGISLFEEL